MEPEEFKEDLNNIHICPDCKEYPPNLTEEFSSGDLVCTSCGLVVGERIIDTRSEWRTFADSDKGEDPNRVGDDAGNAFDNGALETNIAFSDTKQGKNLARIQHQNATEKASKAMVQAFKDITVLCDTLHLGHKVCDGAKHLFKVLEEGRFTKGKAPDVVSTTCVFISARKENVGRAFNEVGAVTGHSKKQIGKMFRMIQTYLNKAGKGKHKVGTGALEITKWENASTTGATAYVGRYCNQLGFRQVQKMENLARELAERASSISELASRSPLSLAAACIFMASQLLGDSKSAKEISAVAGVSDGTVKTAYRHLYQAKDDILDDSLITRHKAKIENLHAA